MCLINRVVVNNFPLSLFIFLNAFRWSPTGTSLSQNHSTPLCVFLVQFYKYVKTKLTYLCSLWYSLLLNICRIASKVNQMLTSGNTTFFQGLLYCQRMSFPSNIQISVLRSCSYANKLIWANSKK